MDSCKLTFNFNFIMQLKQFYIIATKVSSRKKCYYFWWSTWLITVTSLDSTACSTPFKVDNKGNNKDPYHRPVVRGIYCLQRHPSDLAWHHVSDWFGWHYIDVTLTSHGRHGVSNHRPLKCLFNILYKPTEKRAPKLLPVCEWESTGDSPLKGPIVSTLPKSQ